MIATTLEQSKKLVELGIDTSTADMYYWCGSSLRIGGTNARDKDLDVPAWSIGALIKVLPATIQTRESIEPYTLMIIRRPPVGDQKDWFEVEYGYRNPTNYGWLNAWYEIKAGEDLMTALYEMAVWLLANNYIKKD